MGVDPGTLTIELCALRDGRVAGVRSLPTSEMLHRPESLLAAVEGLGRSLGPFDLVAAPSGYGLPLLRGGELDERAIRLAFLAAPGAAGGILGLRRAAEVLRRSGQPLVFLPGVIHLPTVPAHRKANRIDMGTADKLCATAVAIADAARRAGAQPAATSLILVELGGAFTAAVAVERGAVVDGLGGTSGPPGFLAAGALDGEVAVLAGSFPKDALFTGGAAWIAGDPRLEPGAWEDLAGRAGPTMPRKAQGPVGRPRMAWLAYVEGIAKAVATLRVSAPSARQVVLSGRLAGLDRLRSDLHERLRTAIPELEVRRTEPPADWSRGAAGGGAPRHPVKEAALGAALLADGLCGGPHAPLVDALRLSEAEGSVLDHLYLPLARDAAERFEALLTGGGP